MLPFIEISFQLVVDFLRACVSVCVLAFGGFASAFGAVRTRGLGLKRGSFQFCCRVGGSLRRRRRLSLIFTLCGAGVSCGFRACPNRRFLWVSGLSEGSELCPLWRVWGNCAAGRPLAASRSDARPKPRNRVSGMQRPTTRAKTTNRQSNHQSNHQPFLH